MAAVDDEARAAADLTGDRFLGLVGLGRGRLGDPVLAHVDGLVDLAGQPLDPGVLPQLAGGVDDLLVALLPRLGPEHVPGTQPDQKSRLEPHWHLLRVITPQLVYPPWPIETTYCCPCSSATRR